MYSSNNSVKSNVDIDNNNTQTQQSNTPSLPVITSNRSESSSPSCTTLLVIDDTSNSEDEKINNTNNNNIPIKLMPPTNAQISHIQMPTNLTPSTSTHLDIINDTVDQQRRRNSSIAKLLGGHPLHNQQYEEINQQILDDQTAQNLSNNNDNGNDSGIQRTRSSITRTLLMNNERTNSLTKLPPKPSILLPPPPPPPSSSSSFPRDFDYLIRQEVDRSDNEHGSATLQKTNSIPKVVQHPRSPNNLSLQSKLKRKRTVSKSSLATSNIPPFALNDPFQLDTSKTNSTSSIDQSQNTYPHHDLSKRPRHLNPQQYQLSSHQTSYSHPKPNVHSLLYNQLSSSQDRSSSNNYSSTYNCPHYSPSINLKLPSPITYLSTSSTTIQNNNNNGPMTSPNKTKSMLNGSNICEPSRPRSYSNLSNQSDLSEISSKTTIPLKKRLIDAYNNEQYPNSSL